MGAWKAGAAAGGAAVVELEDDEAAVGEVLPEQPRRPGVEHGLHAGAAVDHDDRGVAAAGLHVARA